MQKHQIDLGFCIYGGIFIHVLVSTITVFKINKTLIAQSIIWTLTINLARDSQVHKLLSSSVNLRCLTCH